MSCLVPSSTASVLYLPRIWSQCPSLPAFWPLPALSPAWSCGQGVYAGLRILCFRSVFSLVSDGSSDESDHAMEQSSPSPSIVASVPVSTQSTPSSLPHESGHVIEQLPRSSPKAPAVSAPVSVPAQSVTVSAAPATVTVSAFPVTVPVSALVSVAPVTVTAPAPATVTASSAMVTTSVPPTAIAPVAISSSGIVPTSQVSVTPSTASSN